MEADWLKLALDLSTTIGLIVLGIYTWYSNRHKALKTDIEKVDERVDGLSDRMLEAESAIKHMPNHDTLSRIHERINGMGETLSHVEGQTESMNRTLQLIQRHLMDKEK